MFFRIEEDTLDSILRLEKFGLPDSPVGTVEKVEPVPASGYESEGDQSQSSSTTNGEGDAPAGME